MTTVQNKIYVNVIKRVLDNQINLLSLLVIETTRF